MKKTYILTAMLTGLSMFWGCSSNPNTQQQQSNTTEVQQPKLESQSSISEDTLPDRIDIDFFGSNTDYKSDIDFSKVSLNGCNYQQLRILKAYPYALHGFWFKESDINAFFSNRTQWYEKAVEERYFSPASENDDEYWKTMEAYWKTWNEDYYSLMNQIQLSDAQKDFVKRVTEKMSEMEKNKYFSQNSLSLGNPDLLVNSHQFSDLYAGKNKKMKDLLEKYNICFSSTKSEQLFAIYEDNDYHCIPNFITTDVYLQAFHMFFDYALKSVEINGIIPRLEKFYTAMHDFAAKQTEEENAEFYDFASLYFAIANYQLTGKNLSLKPQQKNDYNAENELIMKAEDDFSPSLELKVKFPYSLFKPRGHYTRNETYKKYFRSMMWIETASFEFSDEKALKRSITMAYIFSKIGQKERQGMKETDNTLSFLMGEPDNFSIVKLSDYISEKYSNASLTELFNNSQLKTWIKKQFEVCNRVKPKVEVSDPDKINFMPQRYTVDGEILSKMFDEKPNSQRPFPRGLDVFDALGFSPATSLLDTLYKDSDKWKDYGKYRAEVKNTFKNYQGWSNSNYNKWMEVLLSLQNTDSKQPDYMKTSAWGVKNMVSALASWSELKHDAILYAEQPMGAECGGGEDLPSPIIVGYVEPNVKFWSKLLECIDLLKVNLKKFDLMNSELDNRIEELTDQVTFCKTIAEKELSKQKITDDEYGQIRVIGSTLEYFTLSVLDPNESFDSWNLVTGADKKVAVVADVFTRNIMGCDKCGILYEAVGNPNIIYVVVELDGQLYLTRGATFSHYEFVRPLGDRLTDEQWQKLLEDQANKPSQSEWFAPLLIEDNVKVNENYIYSSGC